MDGVDSHSWVSPRPGQGGSVNQERGATGSTNVHRTGASALPLRSTALIVQPDSADAFEILRTVRFSLWFGTS